MSQIPLLQTAGTEGRCRGLSPCGNAAADCQSVGASSFVQNVGSFRVFLIFRTITRDGRMFPDSANVGGEVA